MTRSSSAPRAGVILLDGALGAPAAVKAAARLHRPLICADGGVRHARRLGLRPDFVVGDMDSVPKSLPRWPGVTYWCDFDENRGDFDKALDFALELGLSRVFVAGALGGAIDHAMVNLAVVEQRSAELDIVLLDSGTAQLLGPGLHRLGLAKGRRFSLLALAPGARATLSGARYALEGRRLLPGSRGLGNSSTGGTALRIRSGRIWLLF